MTSFDEKDLYTGLAALHWSAITDTDPRVDQDFYRRAIQQGNGPALELGCGAGRLLLTYLAEGLDVTGCDISADMLEMCRDRAARDGVKPVLYEQAMQDLDVPGRFATIYIPCGSFVLVMDRAAAAEALRRCRDHLTPGGHLVFNVFPPEYIRAEAPTFPTEWAFKAEKALPDGRRLIVSSRDTSEDLVEQIWTEDRRYELYEGEQLLATEVHSGQGRWYYRNELVDMVRSAGFTEITVTGDFTDAPYTAAHTTAMVITAKA